MQFKDRMEAGKKLAKQLAKYKDCKNTLIFALPRGGVPVAYQIAKELNLPLDVIVVRKVGAPQHPEFAIGAIAEGKIYITDQKSVWTFGISEEDLENAIVKKQKELDELLQSLDCKHNMQTIAGKTAIIVDDGLATGLTMRAAILALKQMGAKPIIVAVPVAAEESIKELESEVDEVIATYVPKDFQAVGLWYQHFEQLSDEDVIAILKQSRSEKKF